MLGIEMPESESRRMKIIKYANTGERRRNFLVFIEARGMSYPLKGGARLK